MEVSKMNNDNNLVLGVMLDHEDGVCRAQRWLRGRVILSVVTEHAKVSGELMLNLKGKETTWTTTSSAASCSPGGSCLPGTGRASEKSREIFYEDSVIHTFPSDGPQLEKNMYTYPFSFFLPGSIAPSMELDDLYQGGGCSISYRLRASLGSNLYTDRPIKIVGATLSKTHPHTLPPMCISPKCSDGTVAKQCLVVAVKVDNTHVAKGQVLRFSLSCRNLCRAVDIKRVDISLVEQVSWNAPSWKQGRTHIRTLASLEDVELEGLVKTPDQEHPVRIWKDEDESVEVNNMLRAEMHADISAQRNHIELPIPHDARDTYEGCPSSTSKKKHLITIHHTLQIFLVTREGRSSPSSSALHSHRTPQVTIPIQILDPPLCQTEPQIHHQQQQQHNNNKHRWSPEKTADFATAVWPKDVPARHIRTQSSPAAIPEVSHIE